ncbi:zinc-binding dehydrogenase [Nakamurella sp. YIM 132087]|uniref:Zinc-binding dehydrogenase n=1 Tax=Nakamurella alba TaxID=2665158 RepID=A0A7K1FMZ3_9ACTN|nr:NAD(P)H-quinone oxidoreductase [Nakamurella alba]MTD15537.1 zinc-binding dehydrogenase [Nakamurella alba]
MLAVVVDQPGGPEQLRIAEVPDPVPGPGEVLLDVAATAVNRADLLQRQGHYPPPPGASEILGLECAGTVAALGAGVTGWSVGDAVCALLAGGGYAQRVAVPVTQLLPVPDGLTLEQAAALPEVTCTVWSNLVLVGGLRRGQWLLVHGGASGIGTMAIQVGLLLGARVIVTASRPDALQECLALGAEAAINYTEEDFVERVRDITGGHGADLVLDLVGAKYLARNIAALADGGRIVVIGMQGGAKAELDLGALLQIRGSVTATALRTRPLVGPGSKAEVIDAVRRDLWPAIADGRVRPVIDEVVPLVEIAAAHARLAEGGHVGKIVVTLPGPGTGTSTS